MLNDSDDILNGTEIENYDEEQIRELEKLTAELEEKSQKRKELLREVKEYSKMSEDIKPNLQNEVKSSDANTKMIKRNSTPKLTIKEAFELLSEEQKKYFKDLVDYADSKPHASIRETNSVVRVGVGLKPYVTLYIKRDILIANIKIENDEYLKAKYFNSGNDIPAETPTEMDIKVETENAVNIVKGFIDARVKQMARDKEFKRLAEKTNSQNNKKEE